MGSASDEKMMPRRALLGRECQHGYDKTIFRNTKGEEVAVCCKKTFPRIGKGEPTIVIYTLSGDSSYCPPSIHG